MHDPAAVVTTALATLATLAALAALALAALAALDPLAPFPTTIAAGDFSMGVLFWWW